MQFAFRNRFSCPEQLDRWPRHSLQLTVLLLLTKKERLQGLRLRRYNLTKKYLPHFISTPIREQRLVTFETQHWLQFWKLRTWIHDNLSFLRWFVLVLVVVVEDENKVENWDCGVGSCQNAKQQTKSSYTPAPAEIEMKIEGEFLEWWWVHFWLSIGEMTSGGRSNHVHKVSWWNDESISMPWLGRIQQYSSILIYIGWWTAWSCSSFSVSREMRRRRRRRRRSDH